MLYEALGESPVGAVLDFSHVVASGDDEVDAVRRIDDRIGHVHLRDAVLGDINLSIGRGKVNFPAAIEALTTSGYQGHTAWSSKPTTSKTPTVRPKPVAPVATSRPYYSADQTPWRKPCPYPTRPPSSPEPARSAASGAPRACLASAGWNVAILDLDEPSAKEAADEVAEQRQVQTAGIGCDVTDEGAVEAALAALDVSMPPIGALVNNAGITSPTASLMSPARSGTDLRCERSRLLQHHPSGRSRHG